MLQAMRQQGAVLLFSHQEKIVFSVREMLDFLWFESIFLFNGLHSSFPGQAEISYYAS